MKYRYVSVTDDYDFEGTNDLETAKYLADSRNVMDCLLGKTLEGDDIPESEAPPEDEDEDEDDAEESTQ